MAIRSITRNQPRNLDSSQQLRRGNTSVSVFSNSTRTQSTRGTSRQPLIPPKQLHSTNSTNNGYLQQRPSIKYIEWSDDYYETLVTSRLVKPMVKDPYLPTDRFKKQAVETIVPDVDPALILTPASAVRQTKFEILKAPRPIMPTLVRFAKKQEIAPLKSQMMATSMKEFPKVELRPTTSTEPMNSNKMKPPSTPKLTPIERILFRDKLINDPFQIRRPRRKLAMNFIHQNIVALTECN